MEDKERQNLPNLKICVDNTEEGELSDSDESSSSADSIEVDSEENKNESGKPAEVEFNVTISELESKNKTRPKPEFQTKKYENKDGDFITGIDLTSKEAQEKKEERARRFGIEKPMTGDLDFKTLYASLGLKDDSQRSERGIRPEAIHIRGVDNMNTKDIFKFFQEFAPGGVEWIDDTSCNAVWADKLTATRAMLKLSASYEEVQESDKTDSVKPQQPDHVKPSEDETKKTAGEETAMEVEEYDDNLDLVGDEKKKESESTKDDVKADEDVIKVKETISEKGDAGTAKDMEVEAESDEIQATKKDKPQKQIPWPPGKWRLGHTNQKSRYIFLRFATKADKKLPRAESRSNYYRKYGNPNYGGMVGLISTSRKRRYRAKTYEEELAETMEAIESQRAAREAREHPEEIDSEPSGISPLKRKRGDADQNSGTEEDGLDMEAELRELLQPTARKQRSMRMYADEEEDRKASKRIGRSSGVLGALPGAGAKVKDARELINRGGAAGSRLMMDRMSESPVETRSGDLRLRIRVSPPTDDEEEDEEEESERDKEEDRSESEDTMPPPHRSNVLSRLGPSGPRSDSDSGSDSDIEGGVLTRLGVHSSVGKVRSDLRSRLGHHKGHDNKRYPSMRIEVVD